MAILLIFMLLKKCVGSIVDLGGPTVQMCRKHVQVFPDLCSSPLDECSDVSRQPFTCAGNLFKSVGQVFKCSGFLFKYAGFGVQMPLEYALDIEKVDFERYKWR
jgi:hypothetical protein